MSQDLEQWEDEADAFYRATGYLRPGKDMPTEWSAGDRRLRQDLWNAWCAGAHYAHQHPFHPTAQTPEEQT